ncbi:hypothetical protein LRP88_11557 [Fusarium phalaenopsidis]
MYNVVITELRNAWRIKHRRDVYQYMKPLLTTMTREKDTMRTRLTKPDENVKSLWDTVMDKRSEFRLFDIKGHSVKCRTGAELDSSPDIFYNDVDLNVLEDEILFPDELVPNKKNVPFREIKNGVSRIEDSVLPSTIRHLEEGMEALAKGKDPMKALKAVKDRDNNSIWSIPKVWETGLKQACKETLSDAQRRLLKHYKDYIHDPSFPWPHGFIIQDLVKAFALVAMLFPEAEAATLVTQFIKSKQCDNFRNTLLFNPKERSKTLPNRRSRTSYKFRDPAFWTEWNGFFKTKSFYADVCPFDWGLAIRAIVAIQTKPWLREIDLWKSFTNTDLEFLQGPDPYWLD